jgi:type II secretory pathway pseudopilin PulG
MSIHPLRQGGFTFLWLLFLVAGLGVGMAAIGTLWHTAAQREKEQQLLFVGNEYRRAIESFHKISLPAGQLARLPKTLDELLLDPRFQHTVRHLRRLYPAPITGKDDWGLLKDAQGGIGGVFSLSEAVPLKTAGFPGQYEDFAGAQQYGNWQFKAATEGGKATVAIGVDGTGTLVTEATPPEPSLSAAPLPAKQDRPDPLERARRVSNCSTAKTQGELACGLLLEQGGRAAWLACMSGASQQYAACIKG